MEKNKRGRKKLAQPLEILISIKVTGETAQKIQEYQKAVCNATGVKVGVSAVLRGALDEFLKKHLNFTIANIGERL